MIIVKALSTGSDPWWTYHASLGNSAKLRLNGSQASQTSSDYIWNQTDPTSSVFSLDGANQGSNANGNDFIAYCFAEKTGYSKFGSYTANNNIDGNFIYLGFKPSFFIIKSHTNSQVWHIADNKRIGYNPHNYRLVAHQNATEYTGSPIYTDILSNGIKLRATDTDTNGSGQSYIYMAFGQSLVGSNNVPCTAR